MIAEYLTRRDAEIYASELTQLYGPDVQKKANNGTKPGKAYLTCGQQQGRLTMDILGVSRTAS